MGSRASRSDDPRLRSRLIGVQMLGTESSNTLPAHALAEREIISNVRGFMVYGDAAQANPSAAILDALVKRQIDIALVWGPQAGFYARHSPAGAAPRAYHPRSRSDRSDDLRHLDGGTR